MCSYILLIALLTSKQPEASQPASVSLRSLCIDGLHHLSAADVNISQQLASFVESFHVCLSCLMLHFALLYRTCMFLTILSLWNTLLIVVKNI